MHFLFEVQPHDAMIVGRSVPYVVLPEAWQKIKMVQSLFSFFFHAYYINEYVPKLRRSFAHAVTTLTMLHEKKALIRIM